MQLSLQLISVLSDAFKSKNDAANFELLSAKGPFDTSPKTISLSCFADVALRTAHSQQMNQSSLNSDEVQSLTAFYRILFETMEYLSSIGIADGVQQKYNQASSALSLSGGIVDWSAIDEAISNQCSGWREDSRVQQHPSALSNHPSILDFERHALLELDLEAAALNFDRKASLKFLTKCLEKESASPLSTRRGPSRTSSNIAVLLSKAYNIRSQYAGKQSAAELASGSINKQQRLNVSELAFSELLDRLAVM